jgi:hypothetical protein
MLMERNYRAVLWPILVSAVSTALLIVPLTAEAPAWFGKQPSQWTVEDAQQILTASPWAQETGAVVTRRLTEEQLREGGLLGQPRGVGNEGVDPKGSEYKISPDMLNVFTGRGGDDRSPRSLARPLTLRLCWESALPVRLAELKAHVAEALTLDSDGYQIAVYGVPGIEFKQDPKKLGDPLRNTAALKREGKKDVKPARVEVFQRPEGLAVVYLFPLSAEISARDGQVQFEALIGRISVAHTYHLTEMQFLGKLEL